MTNGHSRRHEDRVSSLLHSLSQVGGIGAVVIVIFGAAVTWQKVEAQAEDINKIERRFERIEKQMNQVVQQVGEIKGTLTFGLRQTLDRLEQIEANTNRRNRNDHVD